MIFVPENTESNAVVVWFHVLEHGPELPDYWLSGGSGSLSQFIFKKPSQINKKHIISLYLLFSSCSRKYSPFIPFWRSFATLGLYWVPIDQEEKTIFNRQNILAGTSCARHPLCCTYKSAKPSPSPIDRTNMLHHLLHESYFLNHHFLRDISASHILQNRLLYYENLGQFSIDFCFLLTLYLILTDLHRDNKHYLTFFTRNHFCYSFLISLASLHPTSENILLAVSFLASGTVSFFSCCRKTLIIRQRTRLQPHISSISLSFFTMVTHAVCGNLLSSLSELETVGFLSQLWHYSIAEIEN